MITYKLRIIPTHWGGEKDFQKAPGDGELNVWRRCDRFPQRKGSTGACGARCGW